MTLIIDGHTFDYEMGNLCRIFFPYQQIAVTNTIDYSDSIVVYTGVTQQQQLVTLKAAVKLGEKCRKSEKTISTDCANLEKECELQLAVLLYGLLTAMCEYTPKWGILTGVRPIKLLRRLIAEMGEPEAIDYFRSSLLVSDEKTELSLKTMRNEQKILSLSRPDSFSLYVSIPFCPSRCSYCSFVSQSVEKAARLIPNYIKLLCEELTYTAKVVAQLNLRLESVYIGGGTPTTLSAGQLGVLIDTINNNFPMETCREFTVEAGRPDTITPEKLLAIKSRGVTRISINPQTMNDEVLHAIGRRHTTEQTLKAFELARECGFDNINMDLIVGLPNDSVPSFQATLSKVLSLNPESVTVHTLALKHSSKITLSGSAQFTSDAVAAGQMLDYADKNLAESGYLPYYLYRQSRMVGNLENTGWAKPGYESPYNVYVMDETHTILACGAGAVSKVKEPGTDKLERIFDFKFPYEYNSRFSEMITRKERVKELYDKFGK
jgi:oxygen-independent coproporphyrinogen-3 oxidase